MDIKKVSEKYLELKKENNFLKIQVYYNLGGYSSQRGYYMSVQPVEVKPTENDNISMEWYTGFTGVKDLLLPVKRKSKKAESTALDLAVEREQELINYVLNKQGLELKQK